MDVPTRLDAIDRHIRHGDAQLAKDELAEILKMPAAAASFDRVIAFCLTLNEPDLVDAFLEQLTGPGQSAALEQSTAASDPVKRMKLELRVIDLQIGKKMRSDAFKRLQKLAASARADDDNLGNIAERLSKIGEDTLAAELFRKILKAKPQDVAIEGRLIRSMIASRQEGGIEKLENFLKRKGVSAIDWEDAAETFQQISRFEQSIKCARTAMSLGGDIAKNRISIAMSLIKLRMPSQAASEMRKIPLDKIPDIGRLRDLARWAVNCGDHALAVKIAEEQWLRQKESPSSSLFFIDCLILSKNLSKAKSILDHLFKALEAKAGLGVKEFHRLAEISFNIFHSDTLELRAIEIGLTQHPGDEHLIAAKARCDARQSFMANHAAYPARPGPSAGLLRRLQRRLSGDDRPV